MKKIIVAVVALVMVSSCATQTFLVDKNIKREVPSSNPHFSKWSHFFLSGIGQDDVQNAAQLCQESGGVSFVEAKQTVGQVLVNIATLGIYTPRTMNIYCKKQ